MEKQINETIKDVSQFGTKKQWIVLKMFMFVLKEMGQKELIVSRISDWNKKDV